MATRLTMRLFACRPNPVRVLTGREEQALMRSLAALPASPAGSVDVVGTRIGGLGFRGFLLEPVLEAKSSVAPALSGPLSLYGGVLDSYDESPARQDLRRVLEYGILDSFIREVEPVVMKLAKKGAQNLYGSPHCKSGKKGPTQVLPGRPAYVPGPWNSNAAIDLNNCYNYANNRRFTSGSVAIPGAGGSTPTPVGSCAAFKTAVKADLLKPIAAVTNGPLSGGGWPVALFVEPGGHDCHFYRQDKSGRWSHKPGTWPVRSCDEAGNAITNIMLADTLDYLFCGLFSTSSSALISG